MKRTDYSIKKIEFLYRNQVKRRKVKVTLGNGNIVYIEACYDSFEQYGGNNDELRATLPIAEKYNGWLHGKEL